MSESCLNILQGNCLDLLKALPDASVDCVVTSPPYWGLRDYGVPPSAWPAVRFAPMTGLPEIEVPAMECCLGLEPDVWSFIGHLVLVFREIHRVLRKEGTCWVNMGDAYCSSGGHSDQACEDRRGSYRIGNRPEHQHRDFRIRGGGLKPKDLIGLPWRMAYALQASGWYLRKDIIWNKSNPMPESVKDRPAGSHEYLFILTKSRRYFFDGDAISEVCSDSTHARCSQDVLAQIGSFRANGGSRNNRPMKAVWKKPVGWDDRVGEGAHGAFHRNGRRPKVPGKNSRQHVNHDVEHAGRAPKVKAAGSMSDSILGMVQRRNKRSVWTIPVHGYKGAHFATFPPALVEPCILAGCPGGGVVLDPFGGSGTVGMVALRFGRRAILMELNPAYVELAKKRCEVQLGLPLSFRSPAFPMEAPKRKEKPCLT